MTDLSSVAFARKGLWTMLGSFSVMVGVAVHSLWYPGFYTSFTLRSVGIVRLIGFFLALGGGWSVVRTLWSPYVASVAALEQSTS
jgi:hypothetical protein